MPPWWRRASFYHIYPLGYCAAPLVNDFSAAPEPRLARIRLQEVADLGCNALYLGPLFESTSHGYDTADYSRVDRRLGSDDDLRRLVEDAHSRGISVVLDGVFNHVGRDFGPFSDLRRRGENSPYRDWFLGVDFDRDNGFGDGFAYQGWEGVESLVSLNLANREVVTFLLDAAKGWVEDFGIDGIRLDVAYLLPFEFLDALSQRMHGLREDFFLLGEVIHGDYASFLSPGRLDAITNYECFKGLWSSFNDRNLFEIAHSLGRLFDPDGLLSDAFRRGKITYNFADNHDVDRLASTLKRPEHLFPAMVLLFCMPGAPSVYYGSEFGIQGTRTDSGDHDLRPGREELGRPHPGLADLIVALNALRRSSPALVDGRYEKLALKNEALCFARRGQDEVVVVAVNADSSPVSLQLAGSEDSLSVFSTPKADVEPVLQHGGRTTLVPSDRGGGEGPGSGVTIELPPFGAAVWRGEIPARHES